MNSAGGIETAVDSLDFVTSFPSVDDPTINDVVGGFVVPASSVVLSCLSSAVVLRTGGLGVKYGFLEVKNGSPDVKNGLLDVKNGLPPPIVVPTPPFVVLTSSTTVLGRPLVLVNLLVVLCPTVGGDDVISAESVFVGVIVTSVVDSVPMFVVFGVVFILMVDSDAMTVGFGGVFTPVVDSIAMAVGFGGVFT